MNQTRSRRLIRLITGLLVIVIPILAVLAVQIAPEQAVRAAPPGDYQQTQADSFALRGPLTVTQTQTAAASATSVAETIAAINLQNTQTAVARTQTAIATNQTAIAATQTAAAEPSSTAIFRDIYEPNDEIGQAYTISAGSAATCNITLWPVGDVDYFRFNAKAGSAYEFFTLNLDPALDTVMTVYNPQGQEVGTNDDYLFGSRASKVIFSATINGFYYARVTNKAAGDPVNKRYCIQVREIEGTSTSTPRPTQSRIPGADICEPNNSYETACLIGPGETLSLNFVPFEGEGPDTDIFRMWVKPNILYTCETLNLSAVNDTNMIFASGPSREQWFAGNDDKAPGDLGSRLSYYSTYTGWLYILVGPVNMPAYADTAAYTYDMTCSSVAATATSTSTFTPTPRPAGGGGGFVPPPVSTATFTPSPPGLVESPFFTPTDTPRPNVIFNPLPTVGSGVEPGDQGVTINVTLYYDSNRNFMPELNEGIMDVAVALYDNATGQLLAFGYTNEAGNVRFPLVTRSVVRVVVPFLNFSQLALGDADILLRVAPQPLPGGIP